ncbi:aminotransferase class III-fold pyridoxal phosphate-dependent enzyme [Nocardia sp. NPDC052278]|uniref:aminotransferase class III-fold pyridoxal phosphate-dependent enzyme n=1 Tax=unclassified Nocardia TaxID=2637762 RepID=UPI003697D036
MSIHAGVTPSNAEVAKADLSTVLHTWSAQGTLEPLALADGCGSTLWDFEGREYLDFSSQLVNANLGYRHSKVVAAIQAQAARLAMVAPSHANEVRAEAARLIRERAPEGFEKVFFTNGGADANENAIRMARLFTGRRKVISHYHSYHGNTGAAIAATGDWRRIENEFSHGHVHVFGPYLYRSPFWATTQEEEAQRALEHIERVIELEGPSTIAAVIIETVPGSAGVLTPPPGYLSGLRDVLDRHGILLILDEVMAGFGRTGHWFALDAFSVRPDLITFAKGVNSGYVPLGGVIVPSDIAHHFDDRVYPGGLTYSGHPLAAASAVAAITAMAEERVVENAASVGDRTIGPALRQLESSSDIVGEVRGSGVMWAIELVSDQQTRALLPAAQIGRIRAQLLAEGLLPLIIENRIHVTPPAVITHGEAERGIAIIAKVLAWASR